MRTLRREGMHVALNVRDTQSNTWKCCTFVKHILRVEQKSDLFCIFARQSIYIFLSCCDLRIILASVMAGCNKMDIKTVTCINSNPWLMMLYSNSYLSVNQYITIMIEVVYIVDGWKQWKKSRLTLHRNRWCLRRLGCGLFVFYYLMYLFNFSLVDSWACKN